MHLRVSGAHGARAGETPVRGLTQESGIEIESFKSYVAGDDIRYVDWNAAARLDQLLTRRFVAEREVPLHIMLDASASMGVPAGDRKFFFGQRLAAALAYIALNNNDPVRVALLEAHAEPAESPLLRHRGRYLRLKPMLAAASPGGATALRDGVRRYLERHRERGAAFVISDFLVPPVDYEAALVQMQSRGLEVEAIHVVGRGERDIERFGGRLLLRDVESGKVREIALSASERRRYAEAFVARTEALRAFCHRAGIGHALVDAGETIEHCLTKILAAAGMLRIR